VLKILKSSIDFFEKYSNFAIAKVQDTNKCAHRRNLKSIMNERIHNLKQKGKRQPKIITGTQGLPGATDNY